jgi:hypothetical protein
MKTLMSLPSTWRLWWRSFATLTLTLVGLLFLPRAQAIACTCSPDKPSVEVSLQAADAVFEGTALTDLQSTTEMLEGSQGPSALQQSLRVSRRWKGDVAGVVSLLTPAQNGGCAQRFEVGVPYVIYAYRQKDGALWVVSCSRSPRVSDAAADLAILGEGTGPLMTADAGTDDAAAVVPSSAGCQIARGSDCTAPSGGILALAVCAAVVVASRASRRDGRETQFPGVTASTSR